MPYKKISADNSSPDVVAHVDRLREAGILSCDALSHNDESGCENPSCWKYKFRDRKGSFEELDWLMQKAAEEPDDTEE